MHLIEIYTANNADKDIRSLTLPNFTVRQDIEPGELHQARFGPPRVNLDKLSPLNASDSYGAYLAVILMLRLAFLTKYFLGAFQRLALGGKDVLVSPTLFPFLNFSPFFSQPSILSLVKAS